MQNEISDSKTTLTNIPAYPPEEDAICATLIREIGKYNAWADKVAAWDALLQVRMQARCMREERDHLFPNQARKVAGGQIRQNTNDIKPTET